MARKVAKCNGDLFLQQLLITRKLDRSGILPRFNIVLVLPYTDIFLESDLKAKLLKYSNQTLS